MSRVSVLQAFNGGAPEIVKTVVGGDYLFDGCGEGAERSEIDSFVARRDELKA